MSDFAKDTNVSTNDLISRQAAISICDNAIDLWNGQLGTGALVAVRDAIMALPSAQQWIPCSTEMPPTGKDVLVTLEGGTVTDGERWEPQEGKWFLFGGGVNGLDEDVIAWMPLPAPWKGDTP